VAEPVDKQKRKKRRKSDPLKPAHERFLQEIATGRSATEAAQIAFPEQTRESAATTGYRLLRKAEIRERIDQHIEEAAGLTANEVIGTLTSHMRSDILDAFDDSDSPFIKRMRERKLGHLVKAVTIKRIIEGSGEVTIPIEVMRIEFHSSQVASQELGRILGLRQKARENDRDAQARRKVAKALEQLARKHFNGDIEKAKDVWLKAHPDHSKYVN
jgi:phage terminase small subunit